VTGTVEQDQSSALAGGIVWVRHWIGRRRVASKSGRSGPVYNPALGRQAAEVGFADAAEVDLAVRTTRSVYPAWRELSLSRHTEIFFNIRHLVASNRDRMARLVTSEHGKVLSDATAEVQVGIEMIEYACGLQELLKGSFTEQASAAPSGQHRGDGNANWGRQ
jgi:malonate-semialdehyde dehydrogenase (acetylating)/methylmalonate-semialdehyde dehydrogenase